MKKFPFNVINPEGGLGQGGPFVYGRANTGGGLKGRAGGGARPSIEIVPPKGSGVPKKTQPEAEPSEG